MSQTTLNEIARAIVAENKGILAADESTGTIQKRLASISVDNTEENRRAYRDLLFTTKGSGDFISGVILYEETLGQKAKDGKPFTEVLKSQGTIPGIKVDKGAKPLTNFPAEQITEGLDGLRERLAEYHKLGAQFTKWRAVIDIAPGIPTDFCIHANAHALARYAAMSQEANMVPIVEPEVLMDGDHGIERCAEVTRRVHQIVFEQLYEHHIDFTGMLLKPNMIIPGKKHKKQASPEEVADWTVKTFLHSVPAAVPGIVFLSGGQSEQEATANLNAMNARYPHLPWQLSFSYGRALQQSALKAWGGRTENVAKGQKAYLHRARCNGAARSGKYQPDMEKEAPGA
jgi:fructose-bisphosphate aldolase class I